MSLLAGIGKARRRYAGAHAGKPGPFTGKRYTIPAPVWGLNTRDGAASMDEKYAVKMDNYIADEGAVRLRKGCKRHTTGVGSGDVMALIPHQSGTVEKLFAAGSGGIYDITSTIDSLTEAAGSALLSGQNSDRWLSAAFGGSTICCNDDENDDPIRFQPDGTLASAHSWTGTGLSAGKLRHPLPFKGRMFFIENNSANLWYGGIGAVQGTLTSFAMDRVHPEGGNLIGMGSITVDAGSGVDDLACFFFDSGAAAVYQGTDISSATGWSLVGLWNLGRLIGDKALVKMGGELVALTTDGVVPLRTMLTGGRVQENKGAALSDAIAPSFTEAAQLYGNVTGWDSILHTPRKYLIFNIPAPNGQQYVMNTQNERWSRFTGWKAHCFARFKDRLWFGGPNGEVHEAGVGEEDAGVPIEGEVQGAPNYIRTAQEKRFTLARALVEADADVSFSLGATTDFVEAAPLDTTSQIVTEGANWDEAAWDDSEWAGGIFSLNEWQALNANGTALSIRLRSSTKGANIGYYATDVVVDEAEGIL